MTDAEAVYIFVLGILTGWNITEIIRRKWGDQSKKNKSNKGI